MGIDEARTQELAVSKPANCRTRTSVPTVSHKDIVQFALLRVVYNKRDGSIRADAQDSKGNVLDGCGTQGVDQGPDENLSARC